MMKRFGHWATQSLLDVVFRRKSRELDLPHVICGRSADGGLDQKTCLLGTLLSDQ